MATPRGSKPATSPMSRPRAGDPLASMPPATAQPGVSTSTRVSAWPMRPAAPSTAIFMSLIGEDRSRRGREADGVVERRRIPLEASFYAASRPAHKPRLPILLVVVAFTLFAWPAGATESESAYTKLDLKQCKDVTPVVTKLGTDDACHMAYVDATNNPEANEQARRHRRHGGSLVHLQKGQG